MARLSRLYVPDCPILIELQSVAGHTVFKNKESFAAFHARLPLSAQAESLRLYAYCLTPTKALLLIGGVQPQSGGRFVQDLNRHFVPIYRDINPQSTGCIWEPRFRSTVIQPGTRSLKACLFVEYQALYSGLTAELGVYPWSSFRVHAGLAREPWLSDLPAYWQLGNTPFEREAQYLRFANHGLTQGEWDGLTHCLQKGWLWGDDEFCGSVEPLANRPVRPRSRGRPRSGASAQNK